MIEPRIIDDIATKMSQILPPEIRKNAEEVKAQVKGVLQSKLAELNLVTREEFDIQVAVLAKTREKLHTLEQQVKELEQQLLTK